MRRNLKSINKILIPIETDRSNSALRYGLWLAKRTGASVDVFHTWLVPGYLPPQAVVHLPPVESDSDVPQSIDMLARADARAQINEALEAVGADSDVPIGIRVEYGMPAERILEHADEYDVVVMQTHGRTGPSRMLLGSVTEAVVREAPCPVLTVRDEPVSRLERILVPVDMSDGSRLALQQAFDLGSAYLAKVDVLFCHERPEAEAQTHADALADFIQSVGPPPGLAVQQIVVSGNAEEAVLQGAGEYDMLVMGTHGRSGLARAVFGSVTEAVLRKSPTPVMTVRMQDAPATVEQPTLDDAEYAYTIFDTVEGCYKAYRELLDAGIADDDISLIVAEDAYEQSILPRKSFLKEGVGAGAAVGGTLGGILGLIVAIGGGVVAAIPLLTLGPAFALAAAGGLAGGLIGRGVPKELARYLEDAVHRGKALLALKFPDTKTRAKAAKVIGNSGEIVGAWDVV